MRITRVDAFAIKIPRDVEAARGTAGSPAPLLEAATEYRFAESYQTLYSSRIETALVKIETDAGFVGWGESQSPVAPEVVCAIIKTLLAPQLIDEDPMAHERLWSRMYAGMRARGHTGSFMLDAIAGIDTALWDLRGKALARNLNELLGGPFRTRLPAYISGLSGKDQEEKICEATGYQARGFNAFKIFMDAKPETTLDLYDGLRDKLGEQSKLMVDALWRFDPTQAIRFGRELDVRRATWFEAPLKPEDVVNHARLAGRIDTPIAIGESYRTRWEMRPFFESGAVGVLQPDVGRTGITEAMKLAAMAETYNVPIAFHISIGLGVQIAAALHVAASIPNLMFIEYNPLVWDLASYLLNDPLQMGEGVVMVPEGAGLGVEIDEEKLDRFIVR
ncbi:MAG: mandelate racemase/muconate lactonizing enzyme family protein [Acidobacteria bacterium]|nr:mandelate racemase/muconate lactonizing enzyme family protein [Acidobacteriota bacterium]